MKKNYFLKYISILSIIAALGRVIFALMMVDFFSIAIPLSYGEKLPKVFQLAVWAFMLVIVNVIVQLVSGILGAMRWEEPDRAPRCAIWGLISILLGTAANILQIVSGYGASIYVWILGVAIPALYLIASMISIFGWANFKKEAVVEKNNRS